MKVLFVCRANAGRSQIAEAFFNSLSRKHRAVSAGIAVGMENHPVPDPVMRCMAAQGYDLSHARRKHVTPSMIRNADKIVLLFAKGERKAVPPELAQSPKAMFLPAGDRAGRDAASHARMRDQIFRLVTHLAEEWE